MLWPVRRLDMLNDYVGTTVEKFNEITRNCAVVRGLSSYNLDIVWSSSQRQKNKDR